MYGEGEQIYIVEALRDLGSASCGGVRGLQVTGGLMPQHDWHQQIALFDAVAPSRSTSRWARPSHPVARLISPRSARCMPTQKAQRTACLASPVLRYA